MNSILRTLAVAWFGSMFAIVPACSSSNDELTVACSCTANCVPPCFEAAGLDSTAAADARSNCVKGSMTVIDRCSGKLAGSCAYGSRHYRYYDTPADSQRATCERNGGIWTGP